MESSRERVALVREGAVKPRLTTTATCVRQNGEADVALGQAILQNDGLPEGLKEITPLLRKVLERI